mgnify:CR=1 FL=1
MKKEALRTKKGRSPQPTFIDLFGGCGGISLGLMEAGWKGIIAIEKEKMAFETLKHNLTGKKGKNYFNWPEWLDKKPLEISDFNKRHKRNLLSLRGKVDLVAGGPPCQGFSFAGKRGKRDPRNQLFKEYIKCMIHYCKIDAKLMTHNYKLDIELALQCCTIDIKLMMRCYKLGI